MMLLSVRFMAVSSRVSRLTVAVKFVSFGSRFPPGKAICPDQVSLGFCALFTRSISKLLFFCFSSKATAAFAFCSFVVGLSVVDSLWVISVFVNVVPRLCGFCVG